MQAIQTGAEIMTVSIVSRNTIFRNAVVQMCIDRGLPISVAVDSCTKLTVDNVGEILLLHIVDQETPVEEKIEHVLARFRNIRIVMVSPHSLNPNFEGKYDNKITATIPETAPSEALISILYLACMGYSISPARQGSTPVSDTRSQQIAGKAEQDCEDLSSTKALLSQREIAVLAYLRSGHTNKAIARSLGICDATVKAHLRSSFRRIGARNRTQAAMWASQNLSNVLDHSNAGDGN